MIIQINVFFYNFHEDFKKNVLLSHKIFFFNIKTMTSILLKKSFPFLIAVIMLISFQFTTSCRTNNMSKKERQIQKEKKRRAKDDTVLYQKALKKHMKNQTRATQKEMKRNYRDAQRYNEQKKEFFLKRFIREKMFQRQKKQKG
jgi:hypothetical protein